MYRKASNKRSYPLPQAFIRTRTSKRRRLIETRRLLETTPYDAWAPSLEHWLRGPVFINVILFQCSRFMLILLFLLIHSVYNLVG